MTLKWLEIFYFTMGKIINECLSMAALSLYFSVLLCCAICSLFVSINCSFVSDSRCQAFPIKWHLSLSAIWPLHCLLLCFSWSFNTSYLCLRTMLAMLSIQNQLRLTFFVRQLAEFVVDRKFVFNYTHKYLSDVCLTFILQEGLSHKMFLFMLFDFSPAVCRPFQDSVHLIRVHRHKYAKPY